MSHWSSTDLLLILFFLGSNGIWWVTTKPLRDTLDAYRQAETEHRTEMRAMLARLSVPVAVQPTEHVSRPEPRGRWVEDPEGFEPIFIPDEQDD